MRLKKGTEWTNQVPKYDATGARAEGVDLGDEQIQLYVV